MSISDNKPATKIAAKQTIRMTMAEALVLHLASYESDIDGNPVPLFGGVFAIFGHGNVTCLGEALSRHRALLPTWRGQNEQSMALAAIGFAKAQRRRQMMVASSSIGPGATNMVTAAALAHANRLPVLLLAGDVFANRLPDPVLQQVENFYDPTLTANDCFKPVVRYWDRITHPAQILSSLPQAIATMLDAGDCGPAFLGLCQDTQELAYDYPASFFEKKTCPQLRLRPDREQLRRAAAMLGKAERPLLVCGGGVRYSFAEKTLADWLTQSGIPAVETTAGKASLLAEHPCNIGTLGVIGTKSACELAEQSDLLLAVGTRLQDFTTGSGTLVRKPVLSINAARFDAVKRDALALVSDAKEGLLALQEALREQGGYEVSAAWRETAQQKRQQSLTSIREHTLPTTPSTGDNQIWSYGEVIGCINGLVSSDDIVVSAAGGLPGELNALWQAVATNSVDCEFGYSCMGYEIAGAWGAAIAKSERSKSKKGERGEIVAFCGDGSYLMMNSELYSSVLTGVKMILVLCDNGGYAVIDRLQRAKGGESFNNLLVDTKRASSSEDFCRVDFLSHARAMGCEARKVGSAVELAEAFSWARTCSTSVVLLCETHPRRWAPASEAWWDVGVPQESENEKVREARLEARLEQAKGRTKQAGG